MGVGFPDKKIVLRNEITEGGHLSTVSVARFELHWETELTNEQAGDLRAAIYGGDNDHAREIIERARRGKGLPLTDREREALRITFAEEAQGQKAVGAEPRIHFEHFEDHANDSRTTAGWRVEAVGPYPPGMGTGSNPLEVLSSALEMDPPLDAAAQDMIRTLVDHLRAG